MIKVIEKQLKMNKINFLIPILFFVIQSYAQKQIRLSISQEQCNTMSISPCGNYFEQGYMRSNELLVVINPKCFYDSYDVTYKLSLDAQVQISHLIDNKDVSSSTNVMFSNKMNRKINRFLNNKDDKTKNLGCYSYNNYNLDAIVNENFEYEEIYILKGFKRNKPLYKKIRSKVYIIEKVNSLEHSNYLQKNIQLQNYDCNGCKSQKPR